VTGEDELTGEAEFTIYRGKGGATALSPRAGSSAPILTLDMWQADLVLFLQSRGGSGAEHQA
jgi:hypothetical protein